MSYFDKFGDLEANDKKLHVRDVIPVHTKQLVDFIRHYAQREVEAPRENIFKTDHCTFNCTGGQMAYYAILATKYYLGEKMGYEKFQEYNEGLDDHSRHDRKFNHLIRWTYDGCYHIQRKETTLDYFINVEFENIGEANNILEEIKKDHNPDSNKQSTWYLLALAAAGENDLVERSLETLERTEVLQSNYIRSVGVNRGGYDYWANSISFERNITLALAFHYLNNSSKRDGMFEFMRTWPQTYEGVCWDHGIFDLNPKDPELDLRPCNHKEINIQASAFYLELLKVCDAKDYEVSKARLLENFIETFPPGYDEKRQLPFQGQIPHYFGYFVATQQKPMFPRI